MSMTDDGAPRAPGNAMMRGFMCRCPKCGKGRMFKAYLKVADTCPICSEALYHHRADDAPPYVTIMVVGHIVVPLLVLVEEAFRPAVWLHLAIFLPLTFLLSVLLLPPIKGALVGLQWALRMHGFDPRSPEHEPFPPDASPKAP
ncbi:DUF983 domain-containing protein [Aquabacter sp. CN5-332]|uniref:DUF983 domain-containing protein n=1 Tax=Aquabacter sp. CN5-332 TaxID=3156608 RepID=UPI0032B3AFC4